MNKKKVVFMKKIILSLAMSYLLLATASGQSIFPTPSTPIYIPNTPEASKLIGQVQFPVEYNTGLANIEIPIYEIKLKELTIPIKIVYNSSGFKPQIISEAGTGWVLVAEPYIARQVNGLPDENYFYSNQFRTEQEFGHYTIAEMAYGIADGLPDQFFYKLPGKGGSFFTKRSFTDKTVRGFATVPYDPIKISAPENLKQFEILDTDGTRYAFAGKEMTYRVIRGRSVPYSSCYKATSITTAYNETVSFEYNAPVRQLFNYDTSQKGSLQLLKWVGEDSDPTGYYCDSFKYADQFDCGVNTICPPIGSNPSEYYYYRPKYIFTDYESKLLNQIKRGNGENDNDFHLMCSTFSEDYKTWSQESNTSFCSKIIFPGGVIEINMQRKADAQQSLCLQSIKVKNDNGKIIKNVEFDINYAAWNRTRLDKVRFIDADLADQEVYAMEYNNTVGIQSVDHNSWKLTPWGYWNAEESYLKRLPKLSTQVEMNIPMNTTGAKDTIRFKVGENRDYYKTSASDVSQATMLKKITYPTKGYSTFEYEPAVFSHPDRNKNVYTGCLRIKQIANYSEYGLALHKRTFSYGVNNSGLGRSIDVLNDGDFMTSRIVDYYSFEGERGWHYCAKIYILDIHATPFMDNSLSNSTSIVYDRVEESIEDASGNKLGKTEYLYDYSNVDEIRNRRIVDGGDYERIYRPYYIKKYQGWNTGSLKEVNVYKSSGSAFNLTAKTNYIYTTRPQMDYIQAYMVYPLSEIEYLNAPLGTTIVGLSCGSAGAPRMYFRAGGDNSFHTGAKLLTGKNETVYNETGSVSTLTSYTYNNELLLQETTTTGSDNIVYKAVKKYPKDFTDGISAQMVENHIISPVIRQEEYKNGVFLFHQYNAYKKENNVFVPATTYLKTGTNDQEARIQYLKYDEYGNPVHIIKDGLEEVVCIWGHKGRYLVAEIKNSTYNAVNSALGSSVTPESLSSSASPNMSLIESLRSNANTKDAHITTLTYNPLVGVTSIKDPRQMTTHYDYDSHNRLKEVYFINNGTKNIVQYYDYHYKQ